MTTEDLILGHFDGTLTSAQEAQLQAELNGSPEIRSLYEQHRSLHSMLCADAASLAPSARLDEAVVAAALGAAPEVIGGSVVSWLTGKVVVGISAALVGGISIIMLAGPGAEKPSVPADVPDPVVRTVPASPAPALIEESKSGEMKVVIEPSVNEPVVKEPSSKDPSVKDRSAGSASASTPAPRHAERADEPKQQTPSKPKLKLGEENPTVIRDTNIKTKPDGK